MLLGEFMLVNFQVCLKPYGPDLLGTVPDMPTFPHLVIFCCFSGSFLPYMVGFVNSRFLLAGSKFLSLAVKPRLVSQ